MLCHIVLVREESKVLPTLQWGMNATGEEIWKSGAALESGQHTLGEGGVVRE